MEMAILKKSVGSFWITRYISDNGIFLLLNQSIKSILAYLAFDNYGFNIYISDVIPITVTIKQSKSGPH